MKFKAPRKFNPMPLSANDNAFFQSILALDEVKATYWGKGLPRGMNQERDNYKMRLLDYLNREQGGCCAYCGFGFETKGGPQRDHIAPKKYTQFLFNVNNLILSCPLCNGFDMKKETDTISALDDNYENCDFKLVHPYFDEYSDHIQFTEGGSLIQNLTPKGRYTIDLFKLDTVEKTQSRAMCIENEKIKLTAEQYDLVKDILKERGIEI